MPLETASFISDLVSSNPAASDGLNQADDHIRLIKSTVKATFPNIAGAVTATHTQLNSLLSQLLGTTVYTAPLGTVGAPGYSFIGDTDTGWYSPAANRAALSLGGADALNFDTAKNATFAAGLSAVGPINGPGTIPIGGMIMWTTDTLPSGNGVWAWANGGTLSRTTPGAGKELFDRYTADFGTGTFYGTGNGSTTFNVIDMQDVVPVGKNTMGGAAGNSLLSSIGSGIKNVLNGIFGNDTTTLTTANLPPYTPSGSISVSNGAITIHGADQYAFCGTSGSGIGGGGAFGLTGFNSITATQATSTGSFSGSAQGGSSTAFSNLGPQRVVNFIIRIA